MSPRPSSGEAEQRACVNVSRTITGASANAPSTSPWLLRRPKSTLEGSPGCRRGAPGASAAAASGTAGSGS